MVKRKASAAKGTKAGIGGAKKRRAATAAKGEDTAQGAISSDEGSSDADRKEAGDDEEEDFFETADERRVRLAKAYLSDLEGTRSAGEVREKLVQDVAEQERRSHKKVEGLKLGEARFLKGHKQAPTCVCLSGDERTIYSGGKDCAVLRWDVETGRRPDVLAGARNRFECGGHFEKVLGICLVESLSLLISVGADRMVRLWDPRVPARGTCVAKLHGHNAAVTAVVAEPDGSQVYTGSLDKSVRIWDMRARRSTETLLGHVAGVSAMDIYQKGRPLSGGADKTVRFWKVEKDTHLMFSKHTYSVDAVAAMDSDRLVSGSQDGSLLVWSPASKKPLASATLGAGRWVSSLCALQGANVVFSGSNDGVLRSWQVARSASASEDEKSTLRLSEIAPSVTAPGCINAMAAGKNVLACAVGKEHRLGRWFYNRAQKNGVLLVPLSYREE
eukprot:gnl/TRDRNA2_/TRDRNA2_90678_c0_seq1.p1 gnl/TRDRNA2_/TRDRNA2_90678_c0~~gnl/TRDRNA2_/TRDRNA2_90678_c0_seq1.p1  ORF type:complete len:444 (-),score=68.58 gnl/TRDRNA2_/TRDRNA2_90678_c0_seq1:78-1409(-)